MSADQLSGQDVEQRRGAVLSELRDRYGDEMAEEQAAREVERARELLALEWEGVGL